MFKFDLEFLSFIKKFAYIKLLLFCLFWYFALFVIIENSFSVIPHFWTDYFYNRFAVNILEHKFKDLSPYFLPSVHARAFMYIMFPEFFLIFLISCVLIFIASSNHNLSYINFQKLIKLIIFGLFFEIWILLKLRGEFRWLTIYSIVSLF
jgi:hypothetical protein